jgi:hypothetical protein
MKIVCTSSRILFAVIAMVTLPLSPLFGGERTWLSCDIKRKTTPIGSLRGAFTAGEKQVNWVWVVDVQESAIMGYASGDRTLSDPAAIKVTQGEISWSWDSSNEKLLGDNVKSHKDYKIDRRTLQFVGNGETTFPGSTGKLVLFDIGPCTKISPLPLEENKF